MAKVVKNNITYNSAPSTATLLPYNNTDSGLSATTTKGAIDELADEKADKVDVPEDLEDLDNVSISSATNGQVLKYNGSTWVNADESGGSTVSVTQIQSTGTKIATITVDSVGTDLYAPNGGAIDLDDLSDVTITSVTDGQVLKYDGTNHQWVNGDGGGGGSGGHTILDNEGDSLTQRTNLQFKGAYSDDNATDDTTEVNVVRKMTKAEFDLLSDDEKVGFINITDITSGGDDRFQPVVYSEDEREIGVWTDGKPIYQKSYKITGVNINGGWNVLITSASNIDTFVGGKCALADSTYKYTWDAYYNSSNNVAIYNFLGGAILNASGYITIQYTKTTDTAGSGQWTPQGVPAHHYSEDEQVVGTWIDGNTLYEKTYAITSQLSLTANTWTQTTFAQGNLNRITEVRITDNTGACANNLACGFISDYIALNSPRTVQFNDTSYLTIRYTKSL